MELSQYHFSREQKPCSVSVLIGSRCICIQKLINLELKQILFQSFFERFLFYKMIGDKTPSTNRKLTVVHKMDTLYRFFIYNLGLNLVFLRHRAINGTSLIVMLKVYRIWLNFSWSKEEKFFTSLIYLCKNITFLQITHFNENDVYKIFAISLF